jgi:hypothetical protein
MLHKIKMIKDTRDKIKPNSKRELKKIKNEEIKEERILKSTLGKIKALMSLKN